MFQKNLSSCLIVLVTIVNKFETKRNYTGECVAWQHYDMRYTKSEIKIEKELTSRKRKMEVVLDLWKPRKKNNLQRFIRAFSALSGWSVN